MPLNDVGIVVLPILAIRAGMIPVLGVTVVKLSLVRIDHAGPAIACICAFFHLGGVAVSIGFLSIGTRFLRSVCTLLT